VRNELTTLDIAWASFEHKYIAELIEIEEKARRLIVQAIEHERCLQLIEAHHGEGEVLQHVPEYHEEQRRLVRKLKTGLVEDVWLNCGSDVRLLEEGISFVRAAAASMHNSSDVQILGSVLLPNPAQLQQMRERPWNGVHFSEEYLGSLAGMERCTQSILKLYGSEGVQPIVESKVRNEADICSLENLLQSLRHAQSAQDTGEQIPAKLNKIEMVQDSSNNLATVPTMPNRRWGNGDGRSRRMGYNNNSVPTCN